MRRAPAIGADKRFSAAAQHRLPEHFPRGPPQNIRPRQDPH